MKKLTRNQKIYVAVLAVALLVLVFDQVLFSPDSAGASEPAAFHPSASPTARAKATANRIPELLAAVRKPEFTLASRLNDVAREESLDVEAVEDALRAPDAWFPAEDAIRPLRTDDPEIDKAIERLRQSYTLKSVMGNARGGLAIVASKDGTRSLRIGEDLDGFRLIEVKPRAIVLEQSGATVELALPDGN